MTPPAKTPSAPIGIGIIGMGFMGQTHLAAFRSAADRGSACRIIAVADRDEQRRKGVGMAVGNLAAGGAAGADLLAGVRGYATPQELLADPAVDAVSLCTPTDSHGVLAMAALAAGKHVLIEKPVALDVETIRGIEGAASAAGKVCMPAMCMRFWPGWVWLKEAVADGRFGRVVSASFTRIGSRPTWAPEFYLDSTRSGGALFDLHIHDVDFIYWLFGSPAAVSSSGDDFGVTTLYDYSHVAGGPNRVTASGAWLGTAGFPFKMQYLVEFERAVADFDLTRTPPLRLIADGKVEEVVIPTGAGYEGEAAEFVEAIVNGRSPGTTLAQAVAVTGIVRAERASQRSRTREVL